MKSTTIADIREILKQRAEDAYNKYKNNVDILMEKYGDDYYKHMTSFEKLIFNNSTKEMSDCYDLLNDFNEHNWN